MFYNFINRESIEGLPACDLQRVAVGIEIPDNSASFPPTHDILVFKRLVILLSSVMW